MNELAAVVQQRIQDATDTLELQKIQASLLLDIRERLNMPIPVDVVNK